MAGRLTLVGTPIGNLSAFSPRAVEALRECDFIAAEDTRVTLRLLNHFGIHKPVSYTHLRAISPTSRPLRRYAAGTGCRCWWITPTDVYKRQPRYRPERWCCRPSGNRRWWPAW